MTVRSVLAGACALALAAGSAEAKQQGPGVTDTEIKLGQTMPYSGPASTYGVTGMVEAAFFKEINDKGGINGRRINLISLDDAYSPPKSLEQTRRLVEQEEVFAIYGSLGTAPNSAIHKYVNGKKVPHIMLSTGAVKWNEPAAYPWTMAFYPLYDAEGAIHARHVLNTRPNGKIAILSQNDDSGRDYVRGFKEGLGDKAKAMIVSEATYEVSDPTVDSQILKLKASGADVLFNMSTPKFAAQAIRKVHEIDWKPLHMLVSVANSVGGVIKPAGFEKAQGIVTVAYSKVPLDPLWKDDPVMQEYVAFMKRNGLEGRTIESSAVLGYMSAHLMVKLLERCGDDLTRENLMKQVGSINEETLPMLLPGISVRTTPDNFSAFRTLRLQRFAGESWELFGDPVTE